MLQQNVHDLYNTLQTLQFTLAFSNETTLFVYFFIFYHYVLSEYVDIIGDVGSLCNLGPPWSPHC